MLVKSNRVILGIFFILLLSNCTSQSLGNLKKMTLTIYPPVLPPDALCTTQTYEITPQLLKYQEQSGLCKNTARAVKNQQISLEATPFAQISDLLKSLKRDNFSSTSDYDGNSSVMLQIEWTNTRESFSFLHYEGGEISQLHKLLENLLLKK